MSTVHGWPKDQFFMVATNQATKCLPGVIALKDAKRSAKVGERIRVVSGGLTLGCDDERRDLTAGTSAIIGAGLACKVTLKAAVQSHFVLMAATPIGETFVKRGPLVMSTFADVEQTIASYARGKFGKLLA